MANPNHYLAIKNGLRKCWKEKFKKQEAKMTDEKQKEAKGKDIVQYRSRDGQEIRLSFEAVRKFLVSGHPDFVTDSEVVLYMGTCKAKGMNPFKKDCYLIKYTRDDPAAIIVSIDYYRSRAKAQPDCTGWTAGIIVRHKGIAEPEFREGAILLEGEELLGGWFRARPKGWEIDRTWSVGLKRYIKTTKEGKPTRFWQQESQADMIAKVAESQGLRKVWPDEFAKLYLEEEITHGLPEQEPLKIPQAVAEKENGDKQDETVKDTTRPPSQRIADPLSDIPSDTQQKIREGLKTKSTEKSKNKANSTPPTDKKADLIDWLQNRATREEIMASQNYITENLRGLSGEDQMVVCTQWNSRRKQLRSEEG
ncbi:MAG: phage recombination protein Bet [Candidatus Hydrothermarchaeales archaeon]